MSTAETCSLYYFPEIPNAVDCETKTSLPARFTNDSFKGHDKQASQKEDRQDSAQVQSLIEEAFNKGLEQGRDEINAAHELKINNAVASFETSIKEMRRIRKHDVERMEAETVRLALAIAKKIIGYETEHNAVVQHVVKQAMEKVNDTRHCAIKLNPLDLDAVQNIKQELLSADDLGKTFRIESDEGVERGGCVIETRLGDIDARIERQIKIIEELLVEQIPKSKIQE